MSAPVTPQLAILNAEAMTKVMDLYYSRVMDSKSIVTLTAEGEDDYLRGFRDALTAVRNLINQALEEQDARG